MRNIEQFTDQKKTGMKDRTKKRKEKKKIGMSFPCCWLQAGSGQPFMTDALLHFFFHLERCIGSTEEGGGVGVLLYFGI